MLVWPGRGLSSKNYWLVVGPAILGLLFGMVFTVALKDSLDIALNLYMMFFVFPAVFVLFSVYKFGNQGLSIANQNSILYRSMGRAFCSSVVSVLLGAAIAGFLAYLYLTKDFKQLLMAAGIAAPLSIFLLLAITAFIENSTIMLAIKVSLVMGAFAFVISLLLGPAFFLGLPFVVHFSVSAFLHIYYFSNRKNLIS